MNTEKFTNKKLIHGICECAINSSGIGMVTLPAGTMFTGGVEVEMNRVYMTYVAEEGKAPRNFYIQVIENNKSFYLPYNYTLVKGVICPRADGTSDCFHVYVEKEF
jgi:hypothetical protein